MGLALQLRSIRLSGTSFIFGAAQKCDCCFEVELDTMIGDDVFPLKSFVRSVDRKHSGRSAQTAFGDLSVTGTLKNMLRSAYEEEILDHPWCVWRALCGGLDHSGNSVRHFPD